MNGKRKIAWAGILLGICFALSARTGRAAESDIDAEIASQERARLELSKKIEQYNDTAKKKEQQAKSLLGRLTSLKQNAKMAQQQVMVLELRAERLRKAMLETDRATAETSNKINELVIELRGRLVSMYKYGVQEELNMLLSARNTHDAITSAYLMERLARRDRAVISSLLHKMTELEGAKHRLETNRAQLAEETRELNAQREKYASSIGEASAVLSGVQRERAKAEQAARESEQAQREIGRTILALTQKKRSQGTATAGPDVAMPRGSRLDWPLTGPIASPYGSRIHPVFKTKSFNSGIDIRAAAGAQVKAAGSGSVLFEGWLRGFGQVVIIDHGNSLSTVYANLGSTRVKEGEAVQAGTPVGTVGNTGATAENTLHFEVRVGEAAKNPVDYLKRL